MPNHVHLVLVPQDADGIRRALAVVHRRYAGRVHARLKRTGHFWQGRFGCVPMDEPHLRAAIPYVLLNPVRANLVTHADEWRWSSIHAHLGLPDGITDIEAVRSHVPDLPSLLACYTEDMHSARLRRAESTGRPIGSTDFLDRLERETGRSFAPQRRGPKPRVVAGGDALGSSAGVMR